MEQQNEPKKKSAFRRALSVVACWFGKQLTFQKLLVIFLVYKGVSWVDQSYELAWAGYVEIASDLSRTALTELLGVALIYSVKALFEQLSKNNNWPDKDTSSKNCVEQTGDENTPVG